MNNENMAVYPPYRLVAQFADGARLLFDGLTEAQARERCGDDVMVCRDADGAVLGAASYRCLDSQHLFARLGDPALSALVRQSGAG